MKGDDVRVLALSMPRCQTLPGVKPPCPLSFSRQGHVFFAPRPRRAVPYHAAGDAVPVAPVGQLAQARLALGGDGIVGPAVRLKKDPLDLVLAVGDHPLEVQVPLRQHGRERLLGTHHRAPCLVRVSSPG